MSQTYRFSPAAAGSRPARRVLSPAPPPLMLRTTVPARSRMSIVTGAPVPAVVERDVHPELGAGVQQAGAIGILAHHPRRGVGGDAVAAVGEPLPRLAVILRLVDVRLEVAEQVAQHRDVRGAGAARR